MKAKRTWLLMAAAAFAVLLVIVVPLFLSGNKSAERDAVAQQVEGIRQAVLDYHDAFGEFVDATVAPRAFEQVNADAVLWQPSEGFRALSWQPPTDATRAAFKVDLTSDGFVVTGTCDLDGDGQRAVFKATHDQAANATTDRGVF